MANLLTTNPIVLDTFGADIVVSTGRLKVDKILIASAAAGDKASFIDTKGNPVFTILQQATPGWDESDFGGFVFENGLIYDESASSGLGAGDLVYIYLM